MPDKEPDERLELLEYLAEVLKSDADRVDVCDFERDPGYVYVKTPSGREFIVTVEYS